MKIKKAYLAISYSDRKKYNKEVDTLKKVFQELNIELLVFVDKYNFKENQEKEMMKMAFKELDESDILIAELSTKSIGVGIEIGYAFAKNKVIFYLFNEKENYSTTASGTANFIIKYKNSLDLNEKIKLQLEKII